MDISPEWSSHPDPHKNTFINSPGLRDLFDSWILILWVPAASSFGNFLKIRLKKNLNFCVMVFPSLFKVNVLVLTNQKEEPVLRIRDM